LKNTLKVEFKPKERKYYWEFEINPYITIISKIGEDKKYGNFLVHALSISSEKWKLFVKSAISSYINNCKIIKDGICIEPNKEEKWITIFGFDSKSINISFDEFNSWIKAFIKAMEEFYEVSDSLLGRKGN